MRKNYPMTLEILSSPDISWRVAALNKVVQASWFSD